MATKATRERKKQTKISFPSTTQPITHTRSSLATDMSREPAQPKQKTPSKAAPRTSKRRHKSPVLQTPQKASKLPLFESSSEDELGLQIKSASKPTSRKRQRLDSSSATDNDEDPAVTVPPQKKQRTVQLTRRGMKEKEEAPRPHKRKQVTQQHSTLEDKVGQTPPRSARRGLPRRSSSTSEDGLVLPHQQNDPIHQVHLDSDEESEVPTRSRRRAKNNHSDSESEDKDEEGSSVTRQSGGKENSEQEELKEELAFLRSSPLPDRGRLRSIHGKPKNDWQKALEALKRKRAGIREPSSSVTPKRKKPVVIDTESSSDLEVIQEESGGDKPTDNESEVSDEEDGDDEREVNAIDVFQEVEDDNEFIDDDADAVIGQPSANADLDDLRLTLSLSRAKTSHLFKHAVEWMVMKKIHPAFDSNRNFYTLTFRKLDDEVNGLAGSKFTSSAWSPKFIKSVRARPDLIAKDISKAGGVLSSHCAACNRKNHPASWEVMLTGQPYDKDTLEPLEHDTDSESNSDSDSDSSSVSASSRSSHLASSAHPKNTAAKPQRDASGETLPPESHRFWLGSTCHANAVILHTLHHWRYHLYQWVKQYLARQGHLTAEKLVKRDQWSDRKRKKAAMKIVDQMEGDGEIKKLWNMYKDQVRLAVDARNEYKDGWGRMN